MSTNFILFRASYPDDVVWKVLIDTSDSLLLIEKRDLQTTQVSFDVFDLATKKFLAENIKIWESWWVSAVWIHKKKIVFSLYQEEAPIGKGVFVYDVIEKAILWQNLDLNFFGINSQEACIFLRSNLESSKAQAYCLFTGLPTKQNLPQDENLLGYYLAALYPTESSFYKDLQVFISQKTQQKTNLPIHYAETQRHICLGYGIEIEEKFAYFLLITDIAGNILLQEQLGSYEGTCFFIYQSYLVVLQAKEVRIYFLSHKTKPYEN